MLSLRIILSVRLQKIWESAVRGAPRYDKRCNRTLEGYEAKLHLVDKFLQIRGQVQKIHQLAEQYKAEDIAAISNVILEEL